MKALHKIDLPKHTFGIVSEKGIVTKTPFTFKWMIGKKVVDEIIPFVKSKQGEIKITYTWS